MDKNPDSIIFQIALFSMASMTVLGGTVIAPSLPELEAHFSHIAHISILSKLILTLPALFIMLSAPLAGYLLDRYGRLKFIYPAMAMWSISGAIGYFTQSIYMLLLSRAVFGVATAFVMAGASVLLSDYYQGAKRERALSKQGFFQAFGGAIMLVLGGYLAHINWHYPFLVYFSGLLILLIAVIYLYEVPRHTSQIAESKSEKFAFLPLLPVFILTFFSMSMFYTMPTQIPFYIVGVLGKSGSAVGNSMAIASISTAFSALLYSRLRAYMNINALYILGFALSGVGFMLLFAMPFYSITIIALAFIGASLGILLVNNSSWLFSLAKESSKARAFGFLSSFLFMAQFVSPFLSQPLVEIGGLRFMFGIVCAMSFAGAMIFVGLNLKRRKR